MHRVGKRQLAGCVLSVLFWVTPAPAGDVREFRVEVGDYRFTPSQLAVSPGDKVRVLLVNTDRVTPHNFTLDTDDLNVSVDIPAGKSATVEFTAPPPGRYAFYCRKKLPFMKSHRARGMEGTLVVRDGH